MKVHNHNGAEYGTIEKEMNGTQSYVYFYPKQGWNYSAHELETIAKEMRKVEK